MDLSIIIPVYNTDEDAFKNCLESILSIDRKISYEIIIVDDGSTESKSNEYKKIMNKFTNTVYIYQQNSGVSSARNLGIIKAKGKYLMFVDSDDIMYPESLKLEHLSLNTDIIVYDKKIVRNKKSVETREFNQDEGNIDTKIVIKEFISKSKFHTPFSKIIKKEFILNNKLSFNTKFIFGEDALFNLEMLLCKPNIYYTRKIIYGYNFDYLTYERRWIKFPKILFDNFQFLYNQKVNCLNKLKIKDKEDISNLLNKDYLNATFSYAMTLCQHKYIEYIDILEKLSDFSKQLYVKDLNMGMKVKQNLIKNRRWKIMHHIYRMKKFYMKYVKNNYNQL